MINLSLALFCFVYLFVLQIKSTISVTITTANAETQPAIIGALLVAFIFYSSLASLLFLSGLIVADFPFGAPETDNSFCISDFGIAV